MKFNKNRKVALVTGAAGFIGFHVTQKLLKNNWVVVGLDSFNNFYDVSLKYNREKILLENDNYRSVHGKLEESSLLLKIFEKEKPNIVVHLAAQAGVRHSITKPSDYLSSNVIGSFKLLEAARAFPPKHVLLASTSSIYGANKKMPYSEGDKADCPLSFYAATKKSVENIAYSYSHLYKIPITVFRFFTVYGPWGRPDMAYYKFTDKIIRGQKIDVHNYGNMQRDFTYIDDLTHAIKLLINQSPNPKSGKVYKNDSLSDLCPYRIVNIGNAHPIKLLDFINEIEKNLGMEAKKNFLPLQKGEVISTWANSDLLERLIGFKPKTELHEGIRKFVDWYKNYHCY